MNTTKNIRSEALANFSKLAWPTADIEAWKRTPIRRVDFDRYHPYSVRQAGPNIFASAKLPEGEADPVWAAKLVFSSGELTYGYISEDAQKLGIRLNILGTEDEPPSVTELLSRTEKQIEDRVQACALANLTHGLALTIPDGAYLELPILVEFKETGTEALAAPHFAVLLGSSAKASVVARFSAAENDNLLINAGVTLSAGENSSLSFTLSEESGPKTRYFATARAFISENATILYNEIHIGKGLVKTQGSFDLEGPGSSVRLNGAYLVEEGGHVETGNIQRHKSGRASSTALYKGVIHPKGRSVFQGLIVVEEGAAKTDAYLSNKNLLLGPEARADSIPQLIIKNDDVRCTHGSTTGKIDETELFYLQSRGLSLEESKRLIIAGFFEDILSSVPKAERELLRERIDLSLERP